MKKLAALVCTLFLVAAICVAKPSHEFHASIAEVKYNAYSKTFEVGVRYFTDDLAAALTKKEGKSVRIAKNPDSERLIALYAMEGLQLLGKTGNPMMSNYIGFENQGDITWVYFEIPAANFNLETMQVRYITLFDHFADQVNTVNVFYKDKVATLVFRAAEQADVLPVNFVSNK